jgi:ATP:ADP antiporter, AAA family
VSRASSGPADAGPAILTAGILIAQQVASRATRDALFLSHFPVTALPPVVAASALLGLLSALALARSMSRSSPGRVLSLALSSSAALLLGEWGLSFAHPGLAAVAVYFHTGLFGAGLVSGLWSVVNERFNPHEAKRVVGSISMGASVGGTLGGLATWLVAPVVNVPTMLVALASLHLLALWPLARLRPATTSPRVGMEVRAASGLQLIRESPYLHTLALVVALGALSETLLEYVFNAQAAARSAQGSQLMSFFALFYTSTGLVTLIVQWTLTRRLLLGLGLGGTLSIPPSTIALGSILALSMPRLWPTILLRASQVVLRHSLFRPAYELLYTPLPPERKRPTKAILDVGMDRLGTAAGSGVVMLVLLLMPAAPIPVLLVLLVVLGSLGLGLAPRCQRGYVAALAESLRSGSVALDAGEVVDATTKTTLASFGRQRTPRPIAPAAATDPAMEAIADLCSGDPQRIVWVLHARGPLDLRLVPYVIPLLAVDEVFAEAVTALRGVALSCTGQLVDTLLDPTQDLVVRRRIPRVLKAAPTQRAADGLLLGVGDERFDIRYRCAEALAFLHEENARLEMPREEILAAALRELKTQSQRRRSLDHVFSILSLVFEREPLMIALRALRAGNAVLRGTALEYLDNVLPDPIRSALGPLVGSPERVAPSGRSTDEIREDLLRSSEWLTLHSSALRKRHRT